MWSVFYALQYKLTDLHSIRWALRFTTFFVPWIPYFFLKFCIEYTGTTVKKWLWNVNKGVAWALSLSQFTPWMIGFEPVISPWFILVPLYFSIVIIGLVLLFRCTHNSKNAKYIFYSFLFGFVGGMTNFFTYYKIPIPPYGNYAIGIAIIGITYAVVSQHLQDTNVVISGAITRVVAIVATTFTGFGLAFLYRTLIPHATIWLDSCAAGLFLVATFEVYPRLCKKIKRIPDKLLVKQHFLYEDVAWALTTGLEKCTQLDEVISIIEMSLKDTMQLEIQSMFLLKDIETSPELGHDYLPWDFKENRPSDQILDPTQPELALLKTTKMVITQADTPNHGATIPFVAGDYLLGFVTIKPRNEIAHYTYDDLRMFDLLVPQIGIALDRLRAYAKMLACFKQVQKSASLLSMLNQYAHDIKAPVYTIKIVSDQDKNLTETTKTTIHKAVTRVDTLIQTMLKIADENRIRQNVPVNLIQVLNDVLQFYVLSGVRLKGNLKSTESPQIPPIQGDPNDLIVLFTNLIKNACEAMQDTLKNDLTISIDHLPDENEVQVTIQDTGEGIPEDRLKTLFQISTSHKEGGSGVGLSAIKRIVDEHGAKIEVDSKLRKGTKFTINFPLNKGD